MEKKLAELGSINSVRLTIMSLLLLLVMSGCSAKGIGDNPTLVLASPTLTETPAPTVTKKSETPATPYKTPVPKGTTTGVANSPTVQASSTVEADADAEMEELLKTAYILPVDTYYSDTRTYKTVANGAIMLEVFRRMSSDPDYIPNLNPMFSSGNGMYIGGIQTEAVDNKPSERILPNFTPKFAEWLRENNMMLFTIGLDDKWHKKAIAILGVDIPGRSDACIQQTWRGTTGVAIILVKSNFAKELAKLPPSLQSWLISFFFYEVQEKNFTAWQNFIAKLDGNIMKCFLSGK
jgi:hypothetical protein